ncbi:MAG: type II toxin-antitoxin system HipA family toxin [Bacteroidales bacterium]|nr:type II toxin-antitoxin system HipA family toxin [Bacteroidales bacterium]
MNLDEIKYCPGTLAEGNSTYSRTCLRRVFNGKTVSHILPYNSPQTDEVDDDRFVDNRKRISISGVQEKMSLILDKNKLRLTHEGEQGNYILKPIPRDLRKVDQVPANEHLTMQIAQRVYSIYTAENALIFFKDGKQAYITKRFDVKEDGSKWGIEDFASLAEKTEENAGADFKYGYSYQELAELLKKHVPAYLVEVEKLFSLIVFNYLFSNGDAHLKNFSLHESPNGDYLLSPAYDLMNTRIHVDDTDFALDNGLFKVDFKSEAYKKFNHAGKADFIELARQMEIKESRIKKILTPFLEKQALVEDLLSRSFLDEKTKRAYLLHYNTRRNFLNNE